VLGERKQYDSRNNYCGARKLLRASNAQLLVYNDSNGQDCYYRSDIKLFASNNYLNIEDFDLSDEQEERCAELGLIELVD